jgi:hypothetical protein
MSIRTMRMAKASEADIVEMIRWFKAKENRNVHVPAGWRRIVNGYETLINNCADSTENYLDFCPYLNGHVATKQ